MTYYEKIGLLIVLTLACLIFIAGIDVGEGRVYSVAMETGDIEYQLKEKTSSESCVVVVNPNPYLDVIRDKDYFCDEKEAE